jgi:ubiquinol-cytochrome c reductase cytochrome b subunit
MKKILDWVDQRTGCRKIAHEALYENVPGGARWRYVWGSALTFGFVVQIITGVALWLVYSPGSHTAWESVFYLQNNVSSGWIVRGLHHYTAQAMTVLLVLHLMQVVIDGAYKAPREVNFWFGLVLLFLVLALSLTGYLLPWDQKGFWATKVATNIAGIVPLVGPALQKMLVGGSDFGNATLTRFFALHAGILPGLVIVLIVGHIYLFRRHGLTAKTPLRRPDAPFWPDQVLKDCVACLAVLAAVLVLTLRAHGAELGPPADPNNNYSAARPEWYFLFLFQFLKYFPGGTEAIGALWIPGAILLVIFLMPYFGQWKLGHRFNVGFLFCLLAGAGLLTWRAMAEDRGKPEFAASVRESRASAERIKVLADSPTGIPPSGALLMLSHDPMTQGPRLFARHCASCHRYGGGDALGNTPNSPETASDLKGFGSRAWLEGLLDPARVDSVHYFGGTAWKNGRMTKYVKNKVSAFKPGQKATLANVIAAVSAEASLKSQQKLDADSAADVHTGQSDFSNTLTCGDCHNFHSHDENATAPDLTGYASREWLISFISNPSQDKFFGKHNDRMPSFAGKGILDAEAIGMLADWLRGEWYGSEEAAR